MEGQSNQYIIKNVTTGNVIWCRNKDRRAGTTDTGGKWVDNWFVFEETKAPGSSGTFRIRCPGTNCVLVSRTDRKPKVDGFQVNSDGLPDYGDHHFQFLLEDMEVKNIEYDLRAAQHSDEKPSVITSRELKNGSSIKQTQTFIYNDDRTEEHSFEHTHGFEVSVGQKISVGAWPIWRGEMEIKVSQKNEWKIGEKNIVTTKWSISEPLDVPPHSTVTAELTAKRLELTVPFKMTWIAKDSKAENVTYGVYTGVTYFDIFTNITSVEPKEPESRSLEDASDGETAMLGSNGGAGNQPS